MVEQLFALGYLFAAILFILGIRNLAKVRTAARGNALAASGMLLAIALTLVDIGHIDPRFILGGLALGGLIGAIARPIKLCEICRISFWSR